jgi:hypothetical protein
MLTFLFHFVVVFWVRIFPHKRFWMFQKAFADFQDRDFHIDLMLYHILLYFIHWER